MKTEKLFELLTIVQIVHSKKWENVLQLVDFIYKGQAVIKDKKWDDLFKQHNIKLDLAEISNWQTYEETCIDLAFSNLTTLENINNQLVCDVKIYDGNQFGEKYRLKFTATLWLPPDFIHLLEEILEYAFNKYLEDSYQKYLESQKKLWIDNKKLAFFNND
jgi:hypothetical protein